MTWICLNEKCATLSGAARSSAPRIVPNPLTRLVRPSIAACLSLLLAGGLLSPIFAQNSGSQDPQRNPEQQNPPQPNPAQEHPSLPTPRTAAQQAYNPNLTKPPIPVSLGVAKYDYARTPRALPNLANPYIQHAVPPTVLTNSPQIHQLIHDNKLELTLQDAVELALENSMDIAVQRYNVWIAEASTLKAKTGEGGYQVNGADLPFSTASINPFSFFPIIFDPIVTSTVFLDDRNTPINNPFISGTGATTVSALISHTTQFNQQYQQSFSTGTTLTAQWINTRSSSNAVNFFNPNVSSTLTVGITQQLLNGLGHFVNTRNLKIAKNNRKIADAVFEQQAITTVTNTITAYWELVYARANVAVEQQAVAASEKLYNDNRKQLEIGSLPQLEVTRSEAQLTTDRQNLIVTQTAQFQNEQTLKNTISKDPLAANLVDVEIIPLDKPTPPEKTEAASFADAMKEAFIKRPELRQQAYNVTNAGIDVRATRNALLPSASVTAQYNSFGLAGNSAIRGATMLSSSGTPIVDAAGNPVSLSGTPIFEPTTSAPIIGSSNHGFTTANDQIFHNGFPDYNVTFNLTIPLRNRAAYADNQRAILFERQLEAQLLQLKNAVALDVRNTYIALEQGRAQAETASKARELQQQVFGKVQRLFQLGATNVYNVILTQRDLVAAQAVEVRALATLLEAKANYERAVGRTLEVNRVTIADANYGDIERDTLIPGTLHGKVVGTENPLNPTSVLR